jgi:hypothetical protein
VNRSLDWTELRRIEAGRGNYGQQIETLQRLSDHFASDVPLVYEIISPLAQAELLAGRELVLQNMRTRPERLKTGLNIITENTLRLIDGLRAAGIDGVFYHVGLASHHLMSEAEYQDVGCPYDQKLLGALPDNWWLNTVYVEGSSPMLGIAAQYPAQVLSWDDRESNVSLADGKTGFDGAVCGGLGRWNPMHNGMPAWAKTLKRVPELPKAQEGSSMASSASLGVMAAKRLICSRPQRVNACALPASTLRILPVDFDESEVAKK